MDGGSLEEQAFPGTEPARLPQQRDDLPSLHLAGPLRIFLQDSDSRPCEACLRRRVMPQMTRPPRSPDLNPLQVV